MVMRYFRKPETSASGSLAKDETSQDKSSDLEPSTSEDRDGFESGQSNEPENPVLTEEDELFLRRMVSEEEPPPLPPRPVSADSDEDTKQKLTWRHRWDQYRSTQDRNATADDLMSAAEAVKANMETSTESDLESAKEEKDVKSILDRLDLSSINDKVVGLSSDTQKLLYSFNQVLKDLINGVPTAYDDLEKLLTERHSQLDKLYNSLPSFLQKLIKTIPTRAYAVLAPQLAAAMSSSKEESANESAEPSGDEKKDGKKSRTALPSLKNLVTNKGAIVSMLRSIVTFLETRFPLLLTGTNVVMSLAVFVLLFVFWYCYKRGREIRISKEQAEALENPAEDPQLQISTSDTDHGLKEKIDQMAEKLEQKP